MAISLKKKNEAFDILKTYNGINPYIKMLQKEVYTKGKVEIIQDFQVNYIITNHNFQATQLNKVVQLSDWYAKKKQEDWCIKFIPKKIKIEWLIGETDTTYHCYIRYKQNQEKAIQLFIPKKHLLDDLFAEDYKLMNIDFNKYDEITLAKDENRKLKPHQKEGIQFLLSRKKCILADSPGLGKTTDLVVASEEGGFKKILIICPASIKTTWKRELMWYVPKEEIRVIESIIGKNKSELEEFLGYEIGKSGKKVSELQEEAKKRGKWQDDEKYIIVNYDVLNEFYEIPETRSATNIAKALENSPMLKSNFDLVIIDECHKLSNQKSIRYKIISDFLKRQKPKAIYGVSGTPLTNKPINLYNVLKLIEAEISKDWEFYVRNYCDGKQIPAKGEKQRITEKYIQQKGKPEGTQFWALSNEEKDELSNKIDVEAKKIWITSGASNLDELKEKIKHIYIRRIPEEIPGMVDKSIEERYYELTNKQRAEYERVWDEYIEAQELEETNKSFNRDLTEGIFLRQYVAQAMIPHTIKLAEEHLEDDEKVMIVCCFDDELYALQKYFGDKCVIYNGKMTPKQKDKAEEEFMTNPNKKVFIGHMIACGVGLTLTSANICIFNSYDWVPGNNEQVQLRVHRLSQTKDVIIYYQLFTDTISEHMWETIMKKQLIIDSVIKEEKEK